MLVAALCLPCFAGGCTPRQKSIERLIAELQDPDAHVRQMAAHDLRWHGGEYESGGPRTDAAVQALATALTDSDDDVRYAAAETLELIGPVASRAVPALVRALTDPNGGVRQAAALALGDCGGVAKLAVPALRRAAANDTNEYMREHAAKVLAEIGPLTGNDLPQIKAALGFPDAFLRRQAIAAAQELGLAAQQLLPDLVILVDDVDPEVRGDLATVLGPFSAHSASAKAALRRLLEDRDLMVRTKAARSLMQSGQAPVAHPVNEAAGSPAPGPTR